MTAPAASVPKIGFATGMALPPVWRGALELLVLQPSPFCNLDCDYCYLPDRRNTRRMDFATLDAVGAKVLSAGLAAAELAVVWHSGEPMAVPREWYAEAFARLARRCPSTVRLTHHFQTNAVLIDCRWAAFLREQGVRVGVSVDGPAWLHDRHRVTRDRRGTHARAMDGVAVLREAGVPFHAICVLTREALSHPDEIFDFFCELAPMELCLNVEEAEAAHARSSLAADPRASEQAFRAFMGRIIQRLQENPGALRIREVASVLTALRHPEFGQIYGNNQNQPGKILNVAWDGRVSTYSPELLGQSAPGLGDLTLGNILSDPLPPGAGNSGYLAQRQAIEAGVRRCRDTCRYFDFCLGGAPSNKLGESGRFDVTETLFCRLTQKVVIDVVLAALEHDFARSDRRANACPPWAAP